MDHLSAHVQTAEERIQDVVRSESRLLYTQNKGFLGSRRAQYLQLYQDSLQDDKLVGLPPQQAPNPPPPTGHPSRLICLLIIALTPLYRSAPQPPRSGVPGTAAPTAPKFADFSNCKGSESDNPFQLPSNRTSPIPGQGVTGRPVRNIPAKRYAAQDGGRLLKTYEVEIGLMADVRAYFDVAFQVRIYNLVGFPQSDNRVTYHLCSG